MNKNTQFGPLFMDIKHKINRAGSGEERLARGKADPRFVLEQLQEEYSRAAKLRLVKMEKEANEMKKVINRQVFNIKQMESRVVKKPPLPTTPQKITGNRAERVDSLTAKVSSQEKSINERAAARARTTRAQQLAHPLEKRKARSKVADIENSSPGYDKEAKLAKLLQQAEERAAKSAQFQEAMSRICSTDSKKKTQMRKWLHPDCSDSSTEADRKIVRDELGL